MSSVPLNPWPHRLLLALVAVVFPLIWVGGLVTTYDAGMAVPDWPGTYGYNLFLYPWQTWLAGPWALLIEHGHRLLGSLAGMISIALLASTWLTRSPAWLRTAAAFTLLLVCLQGALGGMRVLGDVRTLALVHGCVGPLFFAWCVVLATATSTWWWNAARKAPSDVESTAVNRLARWAGMTALLAAVQLVLGANLRHVAFDADPGFFRAILWFHLIIAGLLAVHILITAAVALRGFRHERRFWLPAAMLVLLVLVQVALGGATWVVKYGFPEPFAGQTAFAGYLIVSDSAWQATIVTAHVATGSLILAISALLAARAGRLTWLALAGRKKADVSETQTNRLLRKALA